MVGQTVRLNDAHHLIGMMLGEAGACLALGLGWPSVGYPTAADSAKSDYLNVTPRVLVDGLFVEGIAMAQSVDGTTQTNRTAAGPGSFDFNKLAKGPSGVGVTRDRSKAYESGIRQGHRQPSGGRSVHLLQTRALAQGVWPT